MTNSQLRSVMKFHLKNFNDEGVKVSDSTIHNDVLDEDDGFGQANSKAIYKALIRRTLTINGHDDPSWPSTWIDKTVKELAEHFIQ